MGFREKKKKNSLACQIRNHLHIEYLGLKEILFLLFFLFNAPLLLNLHLCTLVPVYWQKRCLDENGSLMMHFCLFTCIEAFLGLTCVFVFPLAISSLAPVQQISLFLVNGNKMYEHALRKDVLTTYSRQNDKAGMTLKDSHTFFFHSKFLSFSFLLPRCLG